MKDVGASHGIVFSYGGTIANTLDSHRLMEFSHKLGGASLQDKVCEALMKFYFESEGDLGSPEELVRVSTSAGLPEAAVRALLASPSEGVDEVLASERKWRSEHAITGVPFFVIDDKFELSGAQEAGDLLKIFETIVSSNF